MNVSVSNGYLFVIDKKMVFFKLVCKMRKSLTSETKVDRIAELFVLEERVTDKPKEHIKEVTYILYLLTIPWTKDSYCWSWHYTRLMSRVNLVYGLALHKSLRLSVDRMLTQCFGCGGTRLGMYLFYFIDPMTVSATMNITCFSN